MHGSDERHHGLDKIRSRALRREVMNGDGQPLVVVVEVDLPPTMIEALSAEDAGEVRLSGYRFATAEPDAEQVERRVSTVRDGIQEITGQRPKTYLASSGSFVIEASGEQIQQIAELPSVAAIWANSGF